jgi:hypothetical protein
MKSTEDGYGEFPVCTSRTETADRQGERTGIRISSNQIGVATKDYARLVAGIRGAERPAWLSYIDQARVHPVSHWS